jgi:hypothetical protein
VAWGGRQGAGCGDSASMGTGTASGLDSGDGRCARPDFGRVGWSQGGNRIQPMAT